MGLIDRLKEEGHHGYAFKWGKNFYLFDETDEVVYNLKTEHRLKWCAQGLGEKNLDCRWVFLYDGGGDKTRFRVRLKDFKKGGILNEQKNS